jgi:gamma-glutamylcyclotransferase (GGCT)/AIG2-like uncharacterized protein YtfP
MHVNVFCYGTLRTPPSLGTHMNLTDAELSEYGQLDIQLNFDPGAELIGRLGGWKLHDRAMYCDEGSRGRGIPAVTHHVVEDAVVIGDLYKVTLGGFRELLRYEGYPRLYDYDLVHVVSRYGSPRRIEEAVVFTSTHAETFGELIHGGDYFAAPTTKEVELAE